MRVLVWGMSNNRAGTESVISGIASSMSGKIGFDFITYEDLSNYPEILSGDNQVLKIPAKTKNYFKYQKSLKSIFDHQAESYDAIWSNLNILNNVDVLRLGKEYGIRKRILHAHNAGSEGNIYQRFLAERNANHVDEYITDRWACSKEAGLYMFGKASFEVIPNAIKFSKFSFDEKARLLIRSEFGLSDALVVGAVGRMSMQKNLAFLLDATSELLRKRPNTYLLLVGEGELLPDLMKHASSLGIDDRIIWAGLRNDVPKVLSAIDVFAMPSLFEGLPVSLLEAQAAGLPCVISDSITPEAVISDYVYRLPIDNPNEWANAIAEIPTRRYPLNRELSSRFDYENLSTRMSALFDLRVG